MGATNAPADPSITSVPPEPTLIHTLGRDVQHLWNDLIRTGFRRTVKRTFADLEEFYLSASSRERLVGMRRGRRVLYLTAWLVKSLFLKLTPARRVLLALSLV